MIQLQECPPTVTPLTVLDCIDASMLTDTLAIPKSVSNSEEACTNDTEREGRPWGQKVLMFVAGSLMPSVAFSAGNGSGRALNHSAALGGGDWFPFQFSEKRIRHNE